MELNDKQVIEGVKSGDITAFEQLFSKYYIFLCIIAEHMVRNQSDAEEIVSDVFVKLWNLRQSLDIKTSLKGYLIKSVQNTSLNYIEQNKFKKNITDSLTISDYKLLAWDSDYPLGQLYEKEIVQLLEKAIASLPDGCRDVFLLSRKDSMRYSDIACKLGISVNTVKTQMKIALSRLRDELKDYLPLLLLLKGIE